MNAYREDRYRVRSYDVDLQKRLRLSGLLNFFQESAWRHAEDLDVGVDHLGSRECFWVLSRLIVKIDRYPVWNEEITVRTWPKGMDKLFALRDFLLMDDSAEVCARASTAWIIVDGKRKRPVRIEPFLSEMYRIWENEALAGTAEKIAPRLDGSVLGRHTAGYSIIDMNRHVNNARYADWITDSFPVEKFIGSGIGELSINYLAEVEPGDSVELKVCPKDNGTCFITGSSGDREHFRSRVVWSSASG